MTKEDVATLFNVIDDECHKLRHAGQAEYAGGEDAFGNFNRLAAMTGISREHVLMIYAIKHLDGIMAYINGHRSQREGVRGRINDLIVYLKLLRCMVEENDADKSRKISTSTITTNS